MVPKKQRKGKKSEVIGLVGLGLDNQDGDYRLTTSEHFLLIGGSQETHERMQDTAIRFTEALGRRGQRLAETPVDVILQLLHEAGK